MPEPLPPTLRGLSLTEVEALLKARKLPPVEQWDSPLCGHSGMRIARDGTWFHDGEPIRRPELVRLFASVLRREADGTHVLVTPVEKLLIHVDATAFRTVDMVIEGDGAARQIAFALDQADPVIMGPSHPLRMIATDAGISPRLAVRLGLEAELTRSLYYELAELALADGSTGIWSNGAYFELDGPE